MRHRKSGRKLGRNSSHRKAMFRNMSASLVHHETIKTTLPKAKELRRVFEPLITLAKEDGVANRRLAFDRLRGAHFRRCPPIRFELNLKNFCYTRISLLHGAWCIMGWYL